MRVQRLEITFTILLEMVAIDDNRRRRFALPPVFLLRLIVWIGIPDDEHQTFCIRRPRKIGYTTFDVGQRLCLAACPIEQPHLSALFLLRFVSTCCEECEVFVIRTPA